MRRPAELSDLPELPLSRYRREFLEALGQGPLLLEAEPGAGKSTLAPLWAFAAANGRQVWLIQPRILAVRGVARRLADLVGDELGQTVGYQVPFERKLSQETRLLVMTPGILLQRLLADPELAGVTTVLLDEVHERAVDQDVAWAFLQEVAFLREDLSLVLMSATPDPALQAQVPQRLFAPGRCFPVAVSYRAPGDARGHRQPLEAQVASALTSIADWERRTTLVFLPGWRAIEECAQHIERLRSAGGPAVVRLHSRVSESDQRRALDPATGPRVILATNIAETSLTIADVTLVIDSGLARRAVYEQRTGVTRLQTRRISLASAEQRRGRAGRVSAGECIRLWPREEALAAVDLPEIRGTDLLPLALRLAHWGSPVEDLPWLEAPNRLALSGARAQLQTWNLLDDKGGITANGQQVAAFGTHPRLAVLLQTGVEADGLPESLLLLALALHFEALDNSAEDWLALAQSERRRNPFWQRQADRWLKVLGCTEKHGAAIPDEALQLAFRDRIGHRQESGRYRLNSGISVEPDNTLHSEWAVFPVIASRGKGHSGLGWALSLADSDLRDLSQREETLKYTGKQGRCWQKVTQWRMGGSVTDETCERIQGERLVTALLNDIRARPLVAAYPWPESAITLWRRARLAVQESLVSLPDVSEAALQASLSMWLAPFINDSARADALPWEEGLRFYLGFEGVRSLDTQLPEHVVLPSGRTAPVEYPKEGWPCVGGKLQEFFGCEQFAMAGGRVPVRLQLLSPNGSPLAVTGDLASFWRGAYPEVRKEMRGRYPKHPWPEDPLTHAPTRSTKRHLASGR
ncbi:ATP-dependent helicase HrpB [Marinimicrobium sp. ARAG 43.8]|uniref:ATP-dependent helicase HrpB n=1 Tax=Marinimicrobium sp. ARAG 43.8 TaxID=3418719 RepID=UPI003CF57C97